MCINIFSLYKRTLRRRWPPVRFHSGARSLTRLRQRPPGIRLEVWRPSATWQNQRQERRGPSTYDEFSTNFLINILDKVSTKPIDRTSEAWSSWRDKQRTERYGILGHKRKIRQRVRPDTNLYLNYQTERLLTISSGSSLNDKPREKNKEKKSKWLCNSPGPGQH